MRSAGRGRLALVVALAAACGCGRGFADAVELGPPSVEQISPSAGFEGDRVRVSGTAFSDVVAANQVAFGSLNAQVLEARGNTELLVEVPAEARSATVSVTTTAGTGVSAEAFVVRGPGHPRAERLVDRLELGPVPTACSSDAEIGVTYVYSPTVRALLAVDTARFELGAPIVLNNSAEAVAPVRARLGGEGVPRELRLALLPPDDSPRHRLLARNASGDRQDIVEVGRDARRLVPAPPGAPVLAAVGAAGVVHLVEVVGGADEPLIRTRPLPVGTQVVDLAFSADGETLVAGAGEGSAELVVIQTRSGEVRRLALPNTTAAPQGVAVASDASHAAAVIAGDEAVHVVALDPDAPDFRRYLVPRTPVAARFSAAGDQLFVATEGDGRLKRLELAGPAEGQLSGSVEIGRELICLEQAGDPHQLIAVSGQSGAERAVIVSTLALSPVGSVALRTSPREVALVDDGRVLAVGFDGIFTLGLFDAADGTVQSRLQIWQDANPSHMRFDADSGVLVVANRDDNTLAQFIRSEAGFEAHSSAEASGDILDLALGAGAAVLLLEDSDGVRRIEVDPLSESSERRAATRVNGVPAQPVAITSSPSDGRVYALLDDGTLPEIDVANAQVIDATASLTLGECPPGRLLGCVGSMAIARDGSRVWVTVPGGAQVSEWDLVVGEQTRTFNLSAAGGALAVSPDGRRLYVAGGADASVVSIIDLDARALQIALEVGDGPLGVRFSPDGARAYVIHDGADLVSVIE